MKLGIKSYTYTWAIGMPGYLVADPLNAWGLLYKAAALGLSVVQIAEYLPLDSLDEVKLTALVEGALARGVQVEVGTCGIQLTNLRSILTSPEDLIHPSCESSSTPPTIIPASPK